MKIKDAKKILKTMYNGESVENHYWFWFWKLYNIVLDLFEYEGIPKSTNKKSIEDSLILLGYCGFLRKKGTGELFTPFSNIFNFDEYYQPTQLVFANPKVVDYKQYTIGKDCEVIYNTTMEYRAWNLKVDSGLFTFIAKYARMIADIESTISTYTINNRATSYPVADDQNVAASIKAFFEKLALGQRAVISDNSIIEQFRSVDMGKSNLKDGINDWLMARDKVLEMFFRDLGVKMYNPKKAQVTEEEIEVNNQLLVISVDDMLKARKEGLEKVNKMFGTKISVKLNPKYDVQNYRSSEGGAEIA